jgi:hypothetical protein
MEPPELVDETSSPLVDDSLDDSARSRLITALTDSLRDLMLEGDHEGGEVVIRALGELVQLVARAGRVPSGGAEPNVPSNVVSIRRVIERRG